MIVDPTITANTKVCIRCGRELSRSEFQRRSCTTDGLESRCRACLNQQKRETRPSRAHGGRLETPVLDLPATRAKPASTRCPQCGSRFLLVGADGFRSCLMCGTEC